MATVHSRAVRGRATTDSADTNTTRADSNAGESNAVSKLAYILAAIWEFMIRSKKPFRGQQAEPKQPKVKRK